MELLGGIIIKSIILALLVGVVSLAIFAWLNSRGSDLDDQSYDKAFDPYSAVSQNRVTGKGEFDDVDPSHELRHYAQAKRPPPETRKKPPGSKTAPAPPPDQESEEQLASDEPLTE